jgi:hypothetical protein
MVQKEGEAMQSSAGTDDLEELPPQLAVGDAPNMTVSWRRQPANFGGLQGEFE